MRPNNEPHLMRLYLRHCLVGFGLSAVFVAMLLWFDVVGLRGLVARSDVGIMAVFLLWFFHGTIFGSVQFAMVVMGMQTDDNDDGPRRGTPEGLVPVRQEAPKRR